MTAPGMNEYWIPNHEINKKVITKEIQCYLGPDAHVRPYSFEGEDGFLIVSPGPCITDEQIDDICRKSTEMWEKQAAARVRSEKVEPSDKPLKRPLNQPVIIKRAAGSSRPDDRGGNGSSSSGKRSPEGQSSDRKRR